MRKIVALLFLLLTVPAFAQQLGGGGGQSNGGQGGVKGTLMEQTAMGLELLRKLTGQNG